MTTTAAPGRFTGQTPAQRQEHRRRLLLDAAFDLLGTEGTSGTTVRGVCTRSSLNPRYFYESFEDLDALLVAVYDRTATEAFQRMVDAVLAAGDDDEARNAAGIGAMVDYIRDDPRRGRVLFVEGLGNEALARRRMEAMRLLVSGITLVVRAEDPVVADDPAIEVSATLLVGGIAELMIRLTRGELDVDRDQFVADVAELFGAVGQATGAIIERR